MKRFLVTVLTGAALLMAACGAAPEEKTEAVSEQAEESPAEAAAEAAPEEGAEASAPEQVIPRGIWEARAYDVAYRYYEFDMDFDGRTRGTEEGDDRSFTYEDIGDGRILFRYEDKEETAAYRLGGDGRHLVLTFPDRQEELTWISHGTMEDIGGLGIRVFAEDITAEGCRLVLRQMGGYPTGEITVDTSCHLLVPDGASGTWGWKEEVQTGGEPYILDREGKTEREIDWSGEYGSLEPGRYFLYFRIRDVRDTGGDWDAYRYRAEIIVPEDGKKAYTGGFENYLGLPDGTWECGGIAYRYRLAVSGRMSNAARASTFIYLSNLEEIPFERAYMAAGLSSSMDDYYPREEAVLVDWIVE